MPPAEVRMLRLQAPFGWVACSKYEPQGFLWWLNPLFLPILGTKRAQLPVSNTDKASEDTNTHNFSTFYHRFSKPVLFFKQFITLFQTHFLTEAITHLHISFLTCPFWAVYNHLLQCSSCVSHLTMFQQWQLGGSFLLAQWFSAPPVFCWVNCIDIETLPLDTFLEKQSALFIICR